MACSLPGFSVKGISRLQTADWYLCLFARRHHWRWEWLSTSVSLPGESHWKRWVVARVAGMGGSGIIAYRYGGWISIVSSSGAPHVLSWLARGSTCPGAACMGWWEREGSRDGAGVRGRSQGSKSFSHVCWACLAPLLLPLSWLAPLPFTAVDPWQASCSTDSARTLSRRTQPLTTKKQAGFLSRAMVWQGLSSDWGRWWSWEPDRDRFYHPVSKNSFGAFMEEATGKSAFGRFWKYENNSGLGGRRAVDYLWWASTSWGRCL